MLFTPTPLSFKSDGRHWPHRHCSRFVKAFGMTWHVQEMGTGDKAIVLIHGTGASIHSWRALMPILAEHHRIIAVDLPGQGFTEPLRDADPTVPTMALALHSVLKELGVSQATLIGHSAGAAIALALALFQKFDARAVVSINGALYPFPGAGSAIFPAMAKLLFVNPFVPHIFSMGASRRGVERLLDGTGSKLDEEGLALYETLFKNASHVRSTLAWMASWNLKPLVAKMNTFDRPFLQIVGGEDQTIPPGNAYETEQRITNTQTIMMPKRGHLVHEEEPAIVADHILKWMSLNAG